MELINNILNFFLFMLNFILGDEHVELSTRTHDWLRLKYEIHVIQTSAGLSGRATSFDDSIPSPITHFTHFAFVFPFHFRFFDATTKSSVNIVQFVYLFGLFHI